MVRTDTTTTIHEDNVDLDQDHAFKTSNIPLHRRHLVLRLAVAAIFILNVVGWLLFTNGIEEPLATTNVRHEANHLTIALHPDHIDDHDEDTQKSIDEDGDGDKDTLDEDIQKSTDEDGDGDEDTQKSAHDDGDGSNFRVSSKIGTSKRFAYMFYVTSNMYACAATQFIYHLTDELQMNSSRIDVVVLHTGRVGAHLLHKLEDQHHVRTILVDSVEANAPDPTWRESLTKLRTFQDWGYDRVVFLDADAVPLVNLDHLFDLPSATLYAPTAYWLRQPFFTSTLLVIEPGDTLFNDIIQWARSGTAANGFDMDILNEYFAKTVRHLPGVYAVLNSDFRQPPTAKSSLFNTTSELKKHTKIVHFSCKPDGSYGKPWNWPSHDLGLIDRAGFDSLFSKLFVDYWQMERTLCGMQ